MDAIGGCTTTKVLLAGSAISVSEGTWELRTAGAEEVMGCTIAEDGGSVPVGTAEGCATGVLLGSSVSVSEGV